MQRIRSLGAVASRLVKQCLGVDEESVEEGPRELMNPFAFIPMAAVLIASAFVAVSMVWDSSRRATNSMTTIFLCICGWAFVDLMSQMQSDPVDALFWLRLIHLPVLLLSVSVAHLMIVLVPGVADSLRPVVRVGFILAVVIGIAGLFLPGVVDGATATAWGGWTPHYGILSIVLIPLGAVLPVLAAYQVHRQRRRTGQNDPQQINRLRSHAVTAAVTISLAAALSTEYVFPLLGIPFPRLGALAAAVATAAMWLQVLHRSNNLSISAQGTARAVLEDLQDGVALVDSHGLILTSNPRLCEIVGRSASSLPGMPLSTLIDVTAESLRVGLGDREYRIETAIRDRVPVSVSSSCVKNRMGDISWFVVVFRDLRSVDALRRRLLTSGRLAAIGELAAGIAHEVNNPIAFVRSDLNFLRSRLREIQAGLEKEFEATTELDVFQDGESRIDLALAGVGRVAEVVGDVRGFAHVGLEGGAVDNPAVILESAVRLARLERREEVTVALTHFDYSKYVVAGQDLKQVMLALLRVLTIHSRVGQTVQISAEDDDVLLRIVMCGDTVDHQAQREVTRFKMASEEVLEASADDLGLATAIELVDQLGGAVQVSAPTPLSLRIELHWPFEEEEDR